jgi:hypothetical protein
LASDTGKHPGYTINHILSGATGAKYSPLWTNK